MNDITAELDDRDRSMELYAPDSAPQASRMPALAPVNSPAERVFGAQNVAVYRDDTKVLKKIKALAAAAGTDWYYRFPVKKKGGGQDFIEGASIKLANDVARIYGNCAIEVRVHDVGTAWVFYARFTDYETGYSMERSYQQRRGQSSMNTNADRQLDIAFQIGQSKAIRNVIVNALQTYADYGFQEAKRSLVEKIGKDLVKWRERVLEGLEKEGVEKIRVEKVLGRAASDWLAPDVGMVIAMMQSVADGMTTWEEAFPTEQTAAAADATAAKPKAETLDSFADSAKPAAAAAEKAKAAEVKEAKPAAEKPAVASTELDEPTPAKTEPAQAAGPKNAEQYLATLTAHVDAATDAAALKAWFLSDAQKKLREDCKVTPADHEKAKLYTLNKIGSLAPAQNKGS